MSALMITMGGYADSEGEQDGGASEMSSYFDAHAVLYPSVFIGRGWHALT